jgi:predicted aminopeptidase
MLRILLALVTMSSLSSCQLPFYGQAVRGQIEIWGRQRPVSHLLKDPSTPEALRSRLELAQSIVAFAETHLALAAGNNYTTYADLQRDHVLWSVFAAPELSVEPVTWNYPVVGSLAYQGYFSQRQALAFAERQRTAGFDAAVAPVPAYSTLGWFKDPLLNTFLTDEPRQLASLIFHELTHKRYYRAGDTTFSESLAVAVEREGVRRWLLHRGDRVGLVDHEKSLQASDQFVDRVLAARSALATLYASDESIPAKRSRKRQILDELQQGIRERFPKAKTPSATHSFWLQAPLNNAHLNAVSAYHIRVPEFERLLKACDGDWERFYAEVSKLP